jgi:nucleotide-binding universal stress UspA family protein
MFEHILVPLDGSTLAERVFPHVIALAKAFNSRVTLLRVVYRQEQTNAHGMVNPIDWQMRKSEAEAYLESVKEQLMEADIDSEIHLEEGKPAKQIIQYARREDVELIVLSSHGESGLSEWNINSTVQKVLLRAFMPVMIIRAYKQVSDGLQEASYKRIFLPLDGSKRAECILPLAKSISQKHKSKVLLAHIVEEPILPRQMPMSDEEKDLIQELVEKNIREAEKYLTSVKDQFQIDSVEPIIQSSKNATVSLHNIVDREKTDLVLLSAHGLSGEHRWPYGNIALNFIAYGTTPLIIIQDLSEEDVELSQAEQYAQESKGH